MLRMLAVNFVHLGTVGILSYFVKRSNSATVNEVGRVSILNEDLFKIFKFSVKNTCKSSKY